MSTPPAKSASAVDDRRSVRENPAERPTERAKEEGKGKALQINSISGSNHGDSKGINFNHGDDFIPFTKSLSPSSSDAEDSRRELVRNGKGRDRGTSPPVGEWDRGKTAASSGDERKGKARDHNLERSGSKHDGKRKYEIDEDRYGYKKQRLDVPSRKAPWVVDVDWKRCNNVAEMLHYEVEAFVKYISPTAVEDEVRGLVVELITHAVTQSFPDAKVRPFGSFETKLYLPHGDIDIVILSHSMACSDKVTVLHALANTLKRAQIAERVTIIAKAKVPIIKFITTHGRFNVDISINQANGVTAGKIVNGFLNDMHGIGQGLALRSLIMITKLFLSQRSMNEVFSGGLGSYSIVCLAVSFLQMHPKIRRGEIDAEKNLGVLLMEFFELYGSYFNYEEVGISLRDGGTYYNKKQRGWADYYKSDLLSIEDPADRSNDISRGSYGIAKVRATLAGAHGILTAAAYLRAGIISARREGRSVNLRHGYNPEDLSILSNVMGVTQEMINHRRLVQDVFDKRILHRLLGLDPNGISAPGPESRGMHNHDYAKGEHSSRSVLKATEILEPFSDEYDSPDADMKLNSKNQRGGRSRSRGEDGEEGRYEIEKRRFNKMRKLGRRDHVHTVFTNDEETDAVAEFVSSGSGDSDGDEQEYELIVGPSGQDAQLNPRTTAKIESRRSYWLSKGIGSENESD